MSRYIDVDKLWKDTTTYFDYCEEYLELIEKQPTADVVEVKHGEWIEDGYQDYPCVCSVCGIAQDIKAKFLFSFCPNCGARMVSI